MSDMEWEADMFQKQGSFGKVGTASRLLRSSQAINLRRQPFGISGKIPGTSVPSWSDRIKPHKHSVATGRPAASIEGF